MEDFIPGSFDSSSNLGTPIRKIKGLTLSSPSSPSGSSLYPSLDDIEPKIDSSMMDRGYSKKITNKVLKQLYSRANEISQQYVSPPKDSKPMPPKRFNNEHRKRFNKMESIASHYSMQRRPNLNTMSPERIVTMTDNDHTPASDAGKRNSSINMNSATKRRRTFNGPQEVHEDLEPNNKTSPTKDSMNVDKISPTKGSVNLNRLTHGPKISPLKLNIEKNTMPPPRNIPKISPSKISPSKISPSKGSMNLNQLLKTGIEDNVPPPPQRTIKKRASSLELAGVKPPSRISSSNSLKQPSIPPSQSIPSLKSASSFKCHSSNLKKSKSQVDKLHSSPTKEPLERPVKDTVKQHDRLPSFASTPSCSIKTRNYTVPEPFSFYAKPTVSSSQKSLDKFKKFKNKFN